VLEDEAPNGTNSDDGVNDETDTRGGGGSAGAVAVGGAGAGDVCGSWSGGTRSAEARAGVTDTTDRA
jgi:hypothetical protein